MCYVHVHSDPNHKPSRAHAATGLQASSKCTVPSRRDGLHHSPLGQNRLHSPPAPAGGSEPLAQVQARHGGLPLRPGDETFVYLLAVAARGKKTRARAQAASARTHVKRPAGGRGRATPARPRALRQVAVAVARPCRAPVSAAGIRPGPATEKSCRARADGDDGDGDRTAEQGAAELAAKRHATTTRSRRDRRRPPGPAGRGCTRRERRTPSVRRLLLRVSRIVASLHCTHRSIGPSGTLSSVSCETSATTTSKDGFGCLFECQIFDYFSSIIDK